MIQQPKLGTTELLFRGADRLGMNPSWIVKGSAFAVTVNGTEQYINYARSPGNSQLAASLSKDKFLTRKIMDRHGLPNIPYCKAATMREAQEFLHEQGTIIAKPLAGSGSRDIHIIQIAEDLMTIDLDDNILEKYIRGTELRYLVLNGEVIAVHESDYGVSVKADRELARISYPPSQWNPTLIDMSLQITKILGLSFAAIDFMVDDNDTAYILEANTMPGLKWFHSPTRGPEVDVASRFLAVLSK